MLKIERHSPTTLLLFDIAFSSGVLVGIGCLSNAMFLSASPPLLPQGLMDGWPAMEPCGARNWHRLDYLRARLGHRTVPVEVGKHYMAEGWGQQLMTGVSHTDGIRMRVFSVRFVGTGP